MVRTINVNGDKIKVTMRASYSSGNFNGYRGNVNGVKMYFFTDTIEKAIEKAYISYIKKYR